MRRNEIGMCAVFSIKQQFFKTVNSTIARININIGKLSLESVVIFEVKYLLEIYLDNLIKDDKVVKSTDMKTLL